MKIFITGATGYIGSNLIKKLIQDKCDIKALVRNDLAAKELSDQGIKIIKGDITDADSIEGALSGIDVLYHLANVSRWWLKDKNLYTEVNVNGTRNLLNEAEKAGVRKVVFTSSVAAIRQPPGIVATEELPHCGHFESLYARSKYLTEKEVLGFAARRDMDISVLNPGVVIGPRDFKTFGKMLIDFVNGKLIFRAFDDSFVPLVYIDDVVEAHIKAAKSGKPGEKYIIVSENLKIIDIYRIAHEITGAPIPQIKMPAFFIKALAHLFELKAEITGVSPKLAVDAVRAMELGASASNKKTVSELSMEFIPIRQALKKTIDWYRKNGYVK